MTRKAALLEKPTPSRRSAGRRRRAQAPCAKRLTVQAETVFPAGVQGWQLLNCKGRPGTVLLRPGLIPPKGHVQACPVGTSTTWCLHPAYAERLVRQVA